MTRKIENQMITAAIALNKAKQVNSVVIGNTRVDSDASGAVWVYLHGNNIAFIEDKGTHYQVKFNMCGWNTRTTRSRINAILNAFVPGHSCICQRKGTTIYHTPNGIDLPITGGDTWFDADWVAE